MSRKRSVLRAVQRATRDERQALAATSVVRQTASTQDSFQNFAANLGVGADNLSSASTYGFNPVTRVRTLLEFMYRGSWIVGQVVDCIAEDMTKAGVTFHGENDPKDYEKLGKAFVQRRIWKKLADNTKWARLYGASLAVMIIDGQRPETPLRLDAVGRGSFKNLLVLDRWMVNPSLNDLVTDLGSTDLGLPKYYDVVADAPALPRMRIHHSRVIRQIGVELPYWQAMTENLWGMSVVERLFDRLVAFDSGTQGASQLLYKAYLRTLKVKDLRTIVAAGGKPYQGLLEQVALMRRMQSNEGITIIDGEDEFDTHQYSFGGVGDTLMQIGQQLSGASQIPLVRLFGQSPAGLNSTGESDLRNYYDGIGQRQETDLRGGVETLARVTARSEGIQLSEDFSLDFNPLYELNDEEKSNIAKTNTDTITSVEAIGILPPEVILKELQSQSKVTGIWTNITDDVIQAAKMKPAPEATAALDAINAALDGTPTPEAGAPSPGERAPEEQPPRAAREPGARKGPPSTTDALPLQEIHGLPIMIETAKGERRTGDGWEVTMPADYGFIRKTGSAEGADEGMDVFVGPNRDSEVVYVIDQRNLATKAFDEHKVMVGFNSLSEATDCYKAAYNDPDGRMMGVTSMGVGSFKDWMLKGDLTQPMISHVKPVRDRRSRDKAKNCGCPK